MIAILRTACGCEKAINIPFPAPRSWNVAIRTRPTVAFHDGFDKGTPETRPRYKVRRFERRSDDGDYPIYHEVIE